MSDTNLVQLAYVAEDSYGVQKTAVPLQILRYSGESLKQDSGFNESNEIRTDRQTPSLRRTRIETSGAVNFELSYGSYDPLLKAALLADSDWSAPVTVTASTIAAVASGNKYTDSANGFGSLVANQWICVTGFTTAANNGFRRIVSVAVGEITVTGATLVDEAAGGSVTITQGAWIVHGTTLTTFNIERLYSDLTQELALFTGQAINGWSLSVPQEGPITGSFDFIGSSERSINASGGSGYTAASTTETMTSLDLTGLLENQAAMTILSFSLNYANNLRTRLVCGNNGVVSIGKGKIGVTGALQAYYESKTLFDKYLNETASALAMCVSDPAGNRYVLDLPRVKFTAGQRPATGPNGEVVADLQWTAYRHPTQGVTAKIARFAA